MTAYYNEINPFAAQWLRNLIATNLIAPGDVDERSIVDVQPDEVRGYTQCHFFAGIGGWSYALRLAGWPDDRPVWTGSCPCQGFSAAGKQGGFSDPRHLWPEWFRLTRECSPPVIFGEQVAAAIRLGWLDLVQADMEAQGYAVGKAVLGAASVGAPHIRQRLWFVAHPECGAAERWGFDLGSKAGEVEGRKQVNRLHRAGENEAQSGGDGPDGRVFVGGGGELCRMENSQLSPSARLGQHGGKGLCQQEADGLARSGGAGGWWGDAEWLWCRDKKYRPTQPGLLPLAHGVRNRVGKLRGYGNAIVPQVAAEFIAAFMDTQ